VKTTTTVLQLWVRVVGAIQIVLGLFFWTGNADRLIPLHMVLGISLVLPLWILAALVLALGVTPGLAALTIAWGLVMPLLGLTQTRLLPGSTHWVIQVLHLLVGLVAIGLGDTLARRIQRRQSFGATSIKQVQ
jgi:hypothetical protein